MIRVRRLLLPAIVVLLVVSCVVLAESQRARSLLSSYVDLIGFVIAVAAIALILWLMRSVVESEPDPFCLNLTFFAFAGQCIRTGEAIVTKTATGKLFLLFVFALFLLIMQVIVMRAFVQVTLTHYREQLKKAKKNGCPPGEIDRWARLLVKISGTDFLPGAYSWLTSIFKGEPREKSKEQARDMLPDAQFDKESEWLTVEGLTVDDSDRKRLWLSYVLIAAGSWIVFVAALFASR